MVIDDALGFVVNEFQPFLRFWPGPLRLAVRRAGLLVSTLLEILARHRREGRAGDVPRVSTLLEILASFYTQSTRITLRIGFNPS